MEDARLPDDPNINLEAKVNQQVGAVVTRGQKVKQEQIAKPLKVVNLETLNTPINTEKLLEMQNNDERLNKIRVPKGVTEKKCGNSWYAVHKGLLTRHFQSRKVNHGQVVKQIIVPKGLTGSKRSSRIGNGGTFRY